MISFYTSLFRYIKTLSIYPHSFVYVSMGDSAAEGIGASTHNRSYPGVISQYLKRKYKNITFHNLGKRKSPTSWVIRDQLEKAISLRPNLVTISVGANDLRVKNLPWRFEKDLTFLLHELKTKTDATIVITTIPGFSHTSWIPLFLKPVVSVSVKHYNTIIEKVARKEHVVLVDLYQHSHLFSSAYPEATADDGFHPSDFGYALWAQSIIHSLTASKPLVT